MYLKTVLENGVKIISEPLTHLKSASIGIWVSSGSRDEDIQKNGISHFIEHMLFKGTAKRNALQIAKELDAIGGLANAFTGKENTCFHGTVLGKHSYRLSDILADIFLSPRFDPVEMERERQVILQEIRMTEDTASDFIHELLDQTFWGDHPIGRPVLGTIDTVSGITREDIVTHMKRVYVPERIVISSAGNIDHSEIVSFFEPMFAPLKSRETLAERDMPVPRKDMIVRFKELEQVHVCIGALSPSIKDQRRYAASIFNTILGGNMSSRLFQEIREKQGLAYSVYSYLSTYSDSGLMGIYFATDTKNIVPAMETISREIRDIAKGNLSDKDIADAREYLIGGMFLSSESTEGRMMRIAKNEILFGRYIPYEEIVSELERITTSEVVDIANDIFRDGPISMALLGPVDKDTNYREIIESIV